MKRLFTSMALCAMALVSFTACNDPKPEDKSYLGNYESSELTPDEHKQKLEEIALDLLDVVDPADVEVLAESLTSLGMRFEEDDYYEEDYIYSLSRGVKTISIEAIFDVVTRASEQYIIDVNAEDFPYNGVCLVVDEYGDYYVEEGEPGSFKVMWDDSVATFTWGDNKGQYTMYNEEFDEEYVVKLPSTITLSLVINGVEHLNVLVVPNVTDNYTYAPEVTVKINGGYVVTAKTNADSKKVGYSYSFLKDGQKILGAAASADIKGMTNPDNWYVEYYDDWWEETVTYIDPSAYFAENVTTAAAQFDILTLSLLAAGDFKGLAAKLDALYDKYNAIYEEMEEYDESVNKALCEEICKYYNDAVDIAAIYNDTQEKIADVVFQARRYEDYDGWVYYVEEPILVFPDGSKFALEDYFTAESFSGLMERISEFFE